MVHRNEERCLLPKNSEKEFLLWHLQGGEDRLVITTVDSTTCCQVHLDVEHIRFSNTTIIEKSKGLQIYTETALDALASYTI